MENDKLNRIFQLQRVLIEELVKVDDVHLPVDVTSQNGQKLCREVVLRATEELHEALTMLKLWKNHKHVADNVDFDHNAFLEEIVDSLHYIFELLIFVDIGAEQLFQAYRRKHQINMERVKDKLQRMKVEVENENEDDC